jgi:para-nitrobenzyl esterase
MKKVTTLLVLTLFSALTFAQCNGRYETEIFSSVTKTTVNYSDVYTDNAHEMDIYTPDEDTEINRPIILYMHGGSFYGGDKTMTDCIDFCTSMAKRGYVTASLNYRLSDALSFLLSNETQYETVLNAVSDVKSAIRYFRKDFTNGDTYGIDPNTIFVGGYSAGGVIAVHLAFIDNIADLPTSPINVQAIINNVSPIHGLEGDAGNYGYSSDVNGVISFAGGINDVNWIDGNDEPLVSIQGDNDVTVNYYCGPGTNNPLVLDLCGSGEMHPQADNVGLLNDKLIFNGTDHLWAAYGNTNPKFVQAMDFTTNFLYPLLPCNNTTSISEENITTKQLIRITDMLGRNASTTTNATLFYIYDDGSVERKMILN